MKQPRRRRWSGWVACALAVFASACSTTTLPWSERAPTASRAAAMPSFAPALNAALPAVVGVYGVEAVPIEVALGAPRPASAATGGLAKKAPRTDMLSVNIGAGFFVDREGTLVTAAHVVAEAKSVLIKTADRRVLTAQLLGVDEDADIAVLQVRDAGVPVPKMAPSAATQEGDWVIAVGEPFGLPRSAVVGIVSGARRHFAQEDNSLFIQSDLGLSPGNSGGPLLNAQGAVIGMNLRSVVGPFGSASLSLSMPIERVRQLADEIKAGTASKRPRLKASFEDVSAPLAVQVGRASADGAYVTRVDVDGAGRRLGLREGDIVIEFNGHAIGDSADFARWVLAWRETRGTRALVWRDQRYVDLAW